MQNNRTTNLASNCLGEIMDCVAVLVRYVKNIDNASETKFVLKHSDNLKGLWLPYGKITTCYNWLIKAEQLAHQVNTEAKIMGVLQLTRFQLVPNSIYYVRVCYLADIPGTVDIKEDKTALSPIQWYTLDEVIQLFKEKPALLFGPEILDFLKQASQNIFQLAMREVKPDMHALVGKANLVLKAAVGAKCQYDLLLESAKFREQEQIFLFHVFLHFCLPSETMSLQTFREFVISLGWEDSHRISDLFRAFDTRSLNFLTFRDLLLGLAAMEPCTQHGGPPAELRCRYIFRYYSRTSEGLMEYSEYLRLIMDIHKLKGLPTDEQAVLASAIKNAQIFGISSGECLPLNEFLTAIGQLKFRGTSLLLRATTSTLTTIHKWSCGNIDHCTDTSKRRKVPENNTKCAKISATEGNFAIEEVICDKPMEDLSYELATHAVKVRRSGTLVDVLTLWDFNDTQATPNSTFKELRFNRLSSMDAFNVKTKAHELLSGLRYFERSILQEHIDKKPNSKMQFPKDAFAWGEVDMQALFHCLHSLCYQVKEIMSAEPRLLKLNSPAYILGDIHGNYHDLVCFEKTLWRMGPVLTPASFLFLGDYVDRGSYGVEVVAYLFAQKVMAPDKFYLLRGNHELRHIQKMFTFHSECLEKFGENGEEIWEMINQCFDVMPVAAVIDNKIFCVHGGIPPPWNGSGKISSILESPCPLKDPQTAAPIVWELLWNDPLNCEVNSLASVNNDMADNRGFVTNLNRGTGHAFSEDALKEFLTRNGLSHVVRAHEVKQNGFQVQMNGKLLTVFSSSHYCGGSNEAACVLADRHKLRLIRLDTT